MSVTEGIESELDFIEFRQLSQEFLLYISEVDLISVEGVPGPSLLSVSNRHGLIIFPVKFGFGWTKLSTLTSSLDRLDYNRFDLEDEETSAIVVGGDKEDWLVIGNGKNIYVFNLDSFASDPVTYEPMKFPFKDSFKQIVFSGKTLALCGNSLVEVDCTNGCTYPTETKAKFLSGDKKSSRIFIVDDFDALIVLNSGLLPEKKFQKPQDLSTFDVVSLYAVNEWDVLIGLEAKDKDEPYICLYHVDVSSSSTTWTEFFDPTRPRSKKKSTLLHAKLSDWDKDLSDLVVIANSSSADLGTAGRFSSKDAFSAFFLTTEEFIPQLPVSIRQSRSDQYPIGIAFDFTNPELTPSGPEAKPFPASPVLWILTNEGCLCSYRIIKNNSCTQYHGMNLNVAEFPNILRRRPSKPRMIQAEDSKSIADKEEGEIVEAKLDITTISAGYIDADFGKYTNALVEILLNLYNLVQNDFKSMSLKLAETKEVFENLKKSKGRALKHLERDTLRLAQDLDNPAFLKLFNIEKGIHEMAQEIVSLRCFGQSAESYLNKIQIYRRELSKYQGSFGRSIDYLTEQAMKLKDAKESARRYSSFNVDEVKKDAERLKASLLELEQDMGLLKLSQATGKPTVSKAGSENPTKAQIARFAEKMRLRKASDCLHIVTVIDPTREKPKNVPTPIIPPASMYQRVFPSYDPDDFLSEPSDTEEPPKLCTVDEEEMESEYDVESLSDKEAVHEVEEIQKEVKIVLEDDVPIVDLVEDRRPIDRQLEVLEVADKIERVKEKEFEEDERPELVEQSQEADLEEIGHSTDEINQLPLKEFESDNVETCEVGLIAKSGETGNVIELVEERTTAKDKIIGVTEEADLVNAEHPIGVIEPVDEEASTKPAEVISHGKDEESHHNPSAETVQLETTEFGKVDSEKTLVAAEAEEPSKFEDPYVRVVVEEPSDFDMSLESFELVDQDRDSELSKPVAPFDDVFNFMSISAPKNDASTEVKSALDAPPSISQFSAPTQPSASCGFGSFVKPPVLSSFAPKPEESIFGKPSAFGASTPTFGSSFGASTTAPFGSAQSSTFGQTSQTSAFGQSSTLGQASSFGQPSFGQSSFGQSSFGSVSQTPSTFGQFGQTSFGTSSQPSFGSPAPITQPAKVFGQGSTSTSGVTGFGSVSAPPTAPQQQESQEPPKRNLPTSFTQFRG